LYNDIVLKNKGLDMFAQASRIFWVRHIRAVVSVRASRIIRLNLGWLWGEYGYRMFAHSLMFYMLLKIYFSFFVVAMLQIKPIN
jgi:hypothetical protein